MPADAKGGSGAADAAAAELAEMGDIEISGGVKLSLANLVRPPRFRLRTLNMAHNTPR
jgi:hypothetical protein